MSHLNKTEFYVTTGYRRNSGKEHCEPFTTTPLLMAVLIPSSSRGGSRNSTLGKQPPASGHFLKFRSGKRFSLRQNYINQRGEGVRQRKKTRSV